MNLDENTTKIIIAIIGLIIAGAFVSIKIKKESKNKISNTKIKGNNNKIVGGDDNSKK